MSQVALLFPGQGSQESGMGRALAEADTEAMQLWKQAEHISGLPLREIYWEGDEVAMSDTRALQPALTVVNLNLWRLMAGRVTPMGAAGHSLGEFSALVAAQSLSPKTVLEITSLRGRLMAEADPDGKGSMAALLKLDESQVQSIVDETVAESNQSLLIANHNTPVQFVISGVREAVMLACQKAKNQKGRGMELKVSGAFHSPMMAEANKELAPLLQKAIWQKPRFPIYCNLDGQPTNDGESLKEKCLQQMISPVRWIETVRKLYADGTRCWIEIGPKAVLSKMVAPCLKAVAPSDESIRVELVNDITSATALAL